ncbi:MAG: subclass B1 metallo-beta-lactamase, partial [Bacteroidota bacterium]
MIHIDNATSEGLLRWINNALQCQVKAVIITRFHVDCLGGLDTFHKRNIPSYAHPRTITLAKEKGSILPLQDFNTPLVIILEDKKVISSFFEEGIHEIILLGTSLTSRGFFG